MESTPDLVGTVLAGKYRVERVIGAGGMGAVVAARHLHLDELVAIKFLLPEMLQSPEAVERFAREARAAIKIKSEHVARVMDVSVLENGAPMMVMEFLQGKDLAALVDEQKQVPVSDAVEYVLQASEAIAEAHALGIIHRDLKPANLFLTRRSDGSPCVKVLDFGISKMTKAGVTGPGMGMTRTATIMGSPLYMSPEQLTSTRDVDTRTDIWALGTILYQLLAGKPPFEAETMPQLVGIILQQEPTPLVQLNPVVPVPLNDAVLKCLQKPLDKRWRNVGELSAAIVDYAPTRARGSAERIRGILDSAGLATSSMALPEVRSKDLAHARTEASWEHSTDPSKTKSKLPVLAVTGLAGAIVLAGVGLALWRWQQPDPTLGAFSAPPASAPVVASSPNDVDPVQPSASLGIVPSASASPSEAEQVSPPPTASQPTAIATGKGDGRKPKEPKPSETKQPTKTPSKNDDLFNDIR